LDSEQQDFTQNIIEILNTSKISIKPCNNEMLNRLYLSRVNTLKWLLGKSNNDYDDNDLDKLKRIILCKIQQLKKEKKKTIYRIETIRII
jgi:hypothetical protein